MKRITNPLNSNAAETNRLIDNGRNQRIFISYSRHQKPIAAWLIEELEGHEIDVFVDKDERRSELEQAKFGVQVFEDWWARVEKMILGADAIIVVISKTFVASKVCRDELAFAQKHNKRIAPVICGEISDTDVPVELKRLDWIDLRFTRFPPPSEIAVKIRSGLSENVDWIREHTRLLELAIDWDRAEKPRDKLLRGTAIIEADNWCKYRPTKAPPIEQSIIKFVDASRTDELHRTRVANRVKAAFIGFAAILTIAYFAWRNEAFLREKYFQYTAIHNYVLTEEDEKKLNVGDVFTECRSRGESVSTLCPEMVVIPAGSYVMGSGMPEARANEKPPHRVAIGYQFAVSKYEITALQWYSCVENGACPEAGGAGDQPVNGVSWNDAIYYSKWLSRLTGRSYRLLSEAEWEYVARSNTSGERYWGNALGENNANCKDCGSIWDDSAPAPVGSFGANAFGLHDTLGNVWEWVNDNWHNDYSLNPPVNGDAWLGDDGNRVVRGGGWYDEEVNISASSRFTHGLSPDFKSSGLGFRLARDLIPRCPNAGDECKEN